MGAVIRISCVTIIVAILGILLLGTCEPAHAQTNEIAIYEQFTAGASPRNWPTLFLVQGTSLVDCSKPGPYPTAFNDGTNALLAYNANRNELSYTTRFFTSRFWFGVQSVSSCAEVYLEDQGLEAGDPWSDATCMTTLAGYSVGATRTSSAQIPDPCPPDNNFSLIWAIRHSDGHTILRDTEGIWAGKFEDCQRIGGSVYFVGDDYDDGAIGPWDVLWVDASPQSLAGRNLSAPARGADCCSYDGSRFWVGDGKVDLGVPCRTATSGFIRAFNVVGEDPANWTLALNDSSGMVQPVGLDSDGGITGAYCPMSLFIYSGTSITGIVPLPSNRSLPFFGVGPVAVDASTGLVWIALFNPNEVFAYDVNGVLVRSILLADQTPGGYVQALTKAH